MAANTMRLSEELETRIRDALARMTRTSHDLEKLMHNAYQFFQNEPIC